MKLKCIHYYKTHRYMILQSFYARDTYSNDTSFYLLHL